MVLKHIPKKPTQPSSAGVLRRTMRWFGRKLLFSTGDGGAASFTATLVAGLMGIITAFVACWYFEVPSVWWLLVLPAGGAGCALVHDMLAGDKLR